MAKEITPGISQPEVTSSEDGYIFQWSHGSEKNIVVMLSRLNEKSEKIEAEIEIAVDGEAIGRDTPLTLLSGIRFNLLSSSGRETVKKACTNNSFSEELRYYPWHHIIEQVCAYGIRKFREGEPTIELTTNDEVGSLEYLVSPIIPIGKPTAIFGDPGSGKSTLLLILAMVAALPWHDNPLKLGAPAEPSPILYLDYEADADDLRRQLAAFSTGMELGFTSLHYRRCTLPLADDLEAVRRQVKIVGAKAIFVDSMSLAAGGDLNRMDTATSYIRALRELGMTSVSLTHTSKDRESRNKTIIGTVLFEAGFRSVYECRGEEDADTLDIALFHRKFNLGRKNPTLGYRINFNCNGNTIEWHDPRNVPEFVERMSANHRILELLKQGSLSAKEMVEELDITYPAASMALKRLEKAKKVIKLADKKWGLALV